MAVKRSDVDPLKRLEEMEAAALKGGGDERIEQAARGGQAHRARAHRAPARSRAPSSSSTSSSPTAATDFGMEQQKILGDGVVTGYGTVDGRQVFVVRAGLHRLRRLALGRLRHQDLQGDGPGDEGRRAGHRPQRLGRRAHPGGRRVARRLRRHLPPQHAGVGRRPADQRHHGPVRGRRRLLAGDDRLHPDGREHQLHVHHRPRRHQDGDARGGDRRRSSAARTPTRRARAWRHLALPDERACLDTIRELLSYLPQNNTEDPPAVATQGSAPIARSPRSTR